MPYLFKTVLLSLECKMLEIGQPFPKFSLKAVTENQGMKIINEKSYPQKWLIIFFWPKDFTFVCPTELIAFAKMRKEFEQRNAQILGMSIDSEYVHLAWRQNNSRIKDIPFPMLSDIKRELSLALGILNPNEGVSERATYIVDPKGIIRFIMVTDLKVGRNPKEVLRILDALQTDKLCPCQWEKGDQTLS